MSKTPEEYFQEQSFSIPGAHPGGQGGFSAAELAFIRKYMGLDAPDVLREIGIAGEPESVVAIPPDSVEPETVVTIPVNNGEPPAVAPSFIVSVVDEATATQDPETAANDPALEAAAEAGSESDGGFTDAPEITVMSLEPVESEPVDEPEAAEFCLVTVQSLEAPVLEGDGVAGASVQPEAEPEPLQAATISAPEEEESARPEETPVFAPSATSAPLAADEPAAQAFGQAADKPCEAASIEAEESASPPEPVPAQASGQAAGAVRVERDEAKTPAKSPSIAEIYEGMDVQEALEHFLRHEAELQMVAFYLGNQEFTVPTVIVQEVIHYSEPAKLPVAPPFVAGVINLRGKVTPLIYLRDLLEVKQARKSEDRFIIICRFRGLQVGLIIERVHTMYRVAQSDIDWGIEQHLGINVDYISGLLKMNDHLLGIVSVDRIVTGILQDL